MPPEPALGGPAVSAAFAPSRAILALPDGFFDEVEPARFPEHVLRFRNQRWAERVGLGALTDAEWTDAFARMQPLPGSLPQPLALRYHGHQFRAYNPDLGDGRGFLLAQLQDPVDGRLLDLGTKGSGTTPYSRGGDGRLTLKGGVRELLATEMLEALGVYTSKTFSLHETGEALWRGDEPSPTRSSVLVRLGHSHIRLGSFQRHAHQGRPDRVRALAEHVIEHYHPTLASASDPLRALYGEIARRTVTLCGQWMVAGFVHGVLNTDNMSILGLTIDYGPYGWVDNFDRGWTPNTTDAQGRRYRFGQQSQTDLQSLLGLLLALDALQPGLRNKLLQSLGMVGHRLLAHGQRASEPRCCQLDQHRSRRVVRPVGRFGEAHKVLASEHLWQIGEAIGLIDYKSVFADGRDHPIDRATGGPQRVEVKAMLR